MGLNDSCEGIIEMGGEGGFAGPAISSLRQKTAEDETFVWQGKNT